MKKKLVSMLLCTTMVASMLVGCGSSATTEAPASEPAETEAPAEEEAEEEAPAETEAPAEEEAAASTELAYAGDLNIMHYSTSEEAEGNGGSDGFRTMLAEWQEAHPDINLVENVLANDEYKTQIATLAAADFPAHLF